MAGKKPIVGILNAIDEALGTGVLRKSAHVPRGVTVTARPKTISSMTDFIKGTSPDWSGKMYRYGDVNTDRATFFHTDPEGAAYYAPGNSANEIGVHDFDESMIQKPVVFDIDFDEDIKAMAEARGYRYLTPNDIDTSTGDIALDIEEAMPSWEKEGHDSILIYGQTGAETVGNGPEIALFPKRK